MRRRRLIAVIATTCWSLSAIGFGQIVIEEPFVGYTTEAGLVGQAPAVTGFGAGAWSSPNSGLYQASSANLGFYNTNQLLLNGGGSAQIFAPNAANRTVERDLSYNAADTAGTFYLSGIVAAPPPRGGVPQANAGFAMIQVLDNVSDLAAGTFGLQFGINAQEIRLRARNTSNVANTDFTVANSYVPHQNNFFVIKAEQNVSGSDDRISVWLNPADLSSEAAAGAPTATFLTRSLDQTVGTRALDTFGFRTVNFADDSNAAYDAFRLGSAWENVTPHSDVTVIKASDDAHVNGASAGTNFSGDQVMEVKNSASSTFERKAYTRFDLNGLNPATVDQAHLSLTMTHDGGNLDTDQTNAWTFNVFGLNDGDAGETWDASTLTWNNAPANDTGDGGAMLANATLLGQFTIGGSPTEQILLGEDELPGLDDFVRATTDDLLSLIVTRDTTGDGGGDIALNTVHGIRSLDFDAANGTNFAPTLLLTTVAIPEPASLLLWSFLGVATLVMGLRFRKSRQ